MNVIAKVFPNNSVRPKPNIRPNIRPTRHPRHREKWEWYFVVNFDFKLHPSQYRKKICTSVALIFENQKVKLPTSVH